MTHPVVVAIDASTSAWHRPVSSSAYADLYLDVVAPTNAAPRGEAVVQPLEPMPMKRARHFFRWSEQHESAGHPVLPPSGRASTSGSATPTLGTLRTNPPSARDGALVVAQPRIETRTSHACPDRY